MGSDHISLSQAIIYSFYRGKLTAGRKAVHCRAELRCNYWVHQRPWERAGSKVGAFVRAAFALGLEHCLTSRFGTVTSQEMGHLPTIAFNFASEEIKYF